MLLEIRRKRRGCTIQDFGPLKKEIETLAAKKPLKLLRALQAHDAGPALPGTANGKKAEFATFE